MLLFEFTGLWNSKVQFCTMKIWLLREILWSMVSLLCNQNESSRSTLAVPYHPSQTTFRETALWGRYFSACSLYRREIDDAREIHMQKCDTHFYICIVFVCIKIQDFPGGAVVKNPPANAGDTGSIPGPEDPTCRGATKTMHHHYWAFTLEPASHNYWARMLQLLKPAHLEPVLRNKRSHHNEKPARHNKE